MAVVHGPGNRFVARQMESRALVSMRWKTAAVRSCRNCGYCGRVDQRLCARRPTVEPARVDAAVDLEHVIDVHIDDIHHRRSRHERCTGDQRRRTGEHGATSHRSGNVGGADAGPHDGAVVRVPNARPSRRCRATPPRPPTSRSTSTPMAPPTSCARIPWEPRRWPGTGTCGSSSPPAKVSTSLCPTIRHRARSCARRLLHGSDVEPGPGGFALRSLVRPEPAHRHRSSRCSGSAGAR